MYSTLPYSEEEKYTKQKDNVSYDIEKVDTLYFFHKLMVFLLHMLRGFKCVICNKKLLNSPVIQLLIHRSRHDTQNL